MCLLFSPGIATATDLPACCRHDDARLSALEAETFSPAVSPLALTIYGQINQAIMAWNDGRQSDAYFVTNDASRTRMGLRGVARVTGDLAANFEIEVGIRSANSKRSTQLETRSGLDLRRAWWGLTSKSFGSVEVGRAVTALDRITETDLSGTRRAGKYADVEDSGLGLLLRAKTSSALSDVAWRRLIKHTGNQPGEGDVQPGLRYISPALFGFTASLSWGADDIWETSLEYEGEISDFRLLGRIGYGRSSYGGSGASFECVATNLDAAPRDASCEMLGGSLSVFHDPTGLYANFGAGWFEDHTVSYAEAFDALRPDAESTFWAMEAGVQRRWFNLGPTTLYGQLFRLQGGANAREAVGAFDAINSLGVDAGIYASRVDMWGVGVMQDLTNVDTKLYLFYRQYDASVTLAGSGQARRSEPLEALQVLMGGALIKF